MDDEKNIFNEFKIEFRLSETGSYSPWHLEIIKKHNMPLMGICDAGYFFRYFFRVGDEIYQTDALGYNKFYEYLQVLNDMYNKNEITKEDIQIEINEIIDCRSDAIDIYVRPCEDLKHFEEDIYK